MFAFCFADGDPILPGGPWSGVTISFQRGSYRDVASDGSVAIHWESRGYDLNPSVVTRADAWDLEVPYSLSL